MNLLVIILIEIPYEHRYGAKPRRLPRESETAETPQGAKRLRRLGARPQESVVVLRNIFSSEMLVLKNLYILHQRKVTRE
ncbi:hypothetical protein CW734_13395 [Planococcus sp. MB-3u-03]|nr:hypothetical protein CW734_13395 [Planococcus sp. MB-3u-03]